MKWVHFPLHPETPLEGQLLKDLFKNRDEREVKARNEQMKNLMAAESLLYGNRTHTYNSRLAQEIGMWADAEERGEAVHDALYRAYFVDAKNISNPEVLLEIVEQTGLSVEKAQKVIHGRTFKKAVDEDWRKSHLYGITGVPTFVAAGRGIVGAQSYETLVHFIESAGGKPREGAL